GHRAHRFARAGVHCHVVQEFLPTRALLMIGVQPYGQVGRQPPLANDVEVLLIPTHPAVVELERAVRVIPGDVTRLGLHQRLELLNIGVPTSGGVSGERVRVVTHRVLDVEAKDRVDDVVRVVQEVLVPALRGRLDRQPGNVQVELPPHVVDVRVVTALVLVVTPHGVGAGRVLALPAQGRLCVDVDDGGRQVATHDVLGGGRKRV